MSAPPPPPPPPPPQQQQDHQPSTVGGSAAAALFAEIRSGGEGIATRLRHVSDEEKTYKKNIQHGEVDMTALLKTKEEVETQRHVTGAAARPAEAPVMALEGDKRWIIKHQVGTPKEQLKLVLSEVNMRHAVRIENCDYVYLEISGKVNSVSIVNCKKFQVSLQSVVAMVEILRSTNCDLQVALAANTIAVEHCSSINIYLLDKEAARETEIVTSCASTVNVTFAANDDDDEVVERALPEQFVSRIIPNGKGGFKVETKPSESF